MTAATDTTVMPGECNRCGGSLHGIRCRHCGSWSVLPDWHPVVNLIGIGVTVAVLIVSGSLAWTAVAEHDRDQRVAKREMALAGQRAKLLVLERNIAALNTAIAVAKAEQKKLKKEEPNARKILATAQAKTAKLEAERDSLQRIIDAGVMPG